MVLARRRDCRRCSFMSCASLSILRIIVLAERQPPTASRHPSRRRLDDPQLVVIGEEPGILGPNAEMTAPVKVARSSHESRL